MAAGPQPVRPIGRVAAGAVAKKILEKEKVEVIAYTLELGGVRAERKDFEEIERNVFRCPDRGAAIAMEKRIEEIKVQGDSLGGILEILRQGLSFWIRRAGF